GRIFFQTVRNLRAFFLPHVGRALAGRQTAGPWSHPSRLPGPAGQGRVGIDSYRRASSPPMRPRYLAMTALFLAASAGAASPPAASPHLTLEPVRGASFRVGGELGLRIRRNTDAWLLPAPEANPGMLEMFRLRDRQPA